MARGPIKHGMSGTKIYRTWKSIISRCHNPNHKNYSQYGGRGIFVDPAWRADFMAFYRSIGDPPSPTHTLDRIDVDSPYAPGNVRWATRKTQANNKRNNRTVTHNGETRTVSEWARLLGINERSLRERLDRGWPIDQAVTTTALDRPRHTILVEHNGTLKSLLELSAEVGLTYTTLHRWHKENRLQEMLARPRRKSRVRTA